MVTIRLYITFVLKLWNKFNLNFKITFQNRFEYAPKWVRAGCAPPPTPGFASLPAPPTQSDQNMRKTQRSRGQVGQHFYTDGHDVTFFALIDLEILNGSAIY